MVKYGMQNTDITCEHIAKFAVLVILERKEAGLKIPPGKTQNHIDIEVPTANEPLESIRPALELFAKSIPLNVKFIMPPPHAHNHSIIDCNGVIVRAIKYFGTPGDIRILKCRIDCIYQETDPIENSHPTFTSAELALKKEDFEPGGLCELYPAKLMQ